MQQRHDSYNRAGEHVVDIRPDLHDDDFYNVVVPRGLVKRRRWQFLVMNYPNLTLFAVCLLLFFLWWLVFAVKVVSIGGKITAIPETDTPLLLNDTRLGITLLAADASQPATLAPQNITPNNATEGLLVSLVCQNTTANNATEGLLVSLVCQNTTANNATEGHLVSSVLQNLTANNCTEALLLMSNQSLSPTIVNVTEDQLFSKQSQNIKPNRVSKIQLASKRRRNPRANKGTAAMLLSMQTRNPKAIKRNAAQPGSSKDIKANNVAGVEAKRSDFI